MSTQIRSEPAAALTLPSPPRWRSVGWVFVVIGLASLAVVVPFVFKGDASGHDFEFHVPSWMEVARQWHQGITYPRWAALANFGYGEPRFVFYPPESWMLGAALSFVLPWGMVPGTFIWLALVLAGMAMYRLAREWLARPDAIAAGVLFAVNPYHLLLVYWRSDFAEMLASAIFPLLVLYIFRLQQEPGRAVAPLAMLVAATWLANAPAGVIVSYAAGLMLVVAAARQRSFWTLVYGGAAMALGVALAAFYIVPAAYEQSWVRISEVLSSGLSPRDNFLFTVTPDPEHTWFNFLVSKVAVGEMAVLALAIAVGAHFRRAAPRLWSIMFALTLACVLLMTPVTSILWTYLPKLRFVQFPWRWLFPLGVPFAALVITTISGARPKLKRALWLTCAFALLACGWALARNAWWDEDGVSDFQEAILGKGAGYDGVDEYTPRAADRYDLVKNAPRVAETVRPDERSRGELRYAPAIRMLRWYPEHREFTVTVDGPTTLILRLLNYPAWRVRLNGRQVATGTSEGTGQMLIPAPAGTSRVEIDFIRTPDRTAGIVISALALLLLALVLRAARDAVPTRISAD